MPWESAARPSLALGLLVALARRSGFDCTALHLNLDLASNIGVPTYEAFAQTLELFPLGEHLFAVDAFGRAELGSDAYLATFGGSGAAPDDPLTRLRDELIPRFLDRAEAAITALQPDVVGFTCTFNQVMASLSLAHRLKAADPAVTILLGGACVHGEMGVAYRDAFPDLVDHVFTGEADESFVAWLRAFECGEPSRPIAGVAGGRMREPAPLTLDLDALPIPDYGDFFAQRDVLCSADPAALPMVRHLPYESSRGCWWGAKSHCTFCGLNNEGMAFRRKSPERVVRELETLAERHGTTSFMASDNILDYRAYKDLLRRLEESPHDYDLFYEIKANVRRDDVAALRRAGVWRVQPGIESFSDHVLELMRKGVTALRNVQLLKLLQEHGIRVDYNILVGFPGETVADYEELLRVLRSIPHLSPPNGKTTSVRVDRFSPFYDTSEELGIRGVRAAGYYRHLIPLTRADPESYAYFFDHDLASLEALRPILTQVDLEIERWKAQEVQRRARLGAGFVEVLTYADGQASRQTLRGLDASIFVAADAVTALPSLGHQLGVRPRDALVSVQRLVRSGSLLRVNDSVVTVVPFAEPHTSADLSDWLRREHGVAPGRLEVIAT